MTTKMHNRSRYCPDKCCGMRVEKTCYIFAVINAVMVGVCVLACIATLGFLATRILISSIHHSFSEYLPTWTVIYPIYAVTCILVAIYGIFAVLLLQGIRMNKPQLIKTYLFFGLVMEMLMMMATAAYTMVVTLGSPYCAILYGGIVLAILICVVFGFILCLVRRTYLILSSKRKWNYNVNEQTVLYICEN